jgi:hypothetical protein
VDGWTGGQADRWTGGRAVGHLDVLAAFAALPSSPSSPPSPSRQFSRSGEDAAGI